MKVRRMAREDVPRIAELERSAFSRPWKADTFRKLLDSEWVDVWVLEVDGTVVAYSVLSCVLDQAELSNIAVAQEMRRRGFGGFLLDRLLEIARGRGARALFLEVRTTNEAAASLYASRGFEEVGRRRDYYVDPVEDARVLVKRL